MSSLGGPDNVLKLENCMTRVRVEVVDERRVDIAALKRVAGVKGVSAPWRTS
ncbi:MAG: PTS transporter subunit EIIB [Sodalis sp. (in: enterobacteria)]|uniref:PTS transporter subunit EIIB n=1 Tax=Sodalis sp. (in: enterobacteria) TaxID=1898979 RepID=UPI0039E70F12